MGRIRTIKPAFYKHEDLYEAEKTSGLPLRVAFSGLWTVCDREGRFAWKPRALKTDVLPYDDCDFSEVLEALVKFGFIVKYALEGRQFGHVPSWHEHQVINPRESKSVIPFRDASPRVDAPVIPARGEVEGKGREKEEELSAITPSMVMRGILSELSLSGRDLSVAVDEVCRAELAKGRDATELRDEMTSAWRDYDAAKPKLSYTKGAAKFFGDGDWKNKVGWPWKEPQYQPVAPKENKALREIEERARKIREERGG